MYSIMSGETIGNCICELCYVSVQGDVGEAVEYHMFGPGESSSLHLGSTGCYVLPSSVWSVITSHSGQDPTRKAAGLTSTISNL